MEIHHKVAGVIIQNRKLLMVRRYDEEHFIIPGGRMEKGETPRQTLERELREELNVGLETTRFLGVYEAPHFRDKNKLVRMETYLAEISGTPAPSNEIKEIIWIDSSYKMHAIKIASIDEDDVVPELKKRGLID